MKYVFWLLWALVNVPVSLFLMNPFLGFMENKESTLWDFYLFLFIVPFLITGIYTLILQWVWNYFGWRKVPIWRLQLLTALIVLAGPVFKLCMVLSYKYCC